MPGGSGLSRPALVLVAVAVAAVLGMVAFLPRSEAEPASAASVPALDWKACGSAGQKGFDCATAKVPLDYKKPRGRAIELALIRHKATDRKNRIGTLFFNPGGPGGAGTEDLPAFFEFFPEQARKRFDVVSWDPRGVGDSTAVQCFANQDAENAFLAKLPLGYPVGRAEQDEWIKTYERFGQLCGRRNGDLLSHVSTLESARDLDLLRRAVGAKRLNYLGTSYGTLLGATYANVFPDKVRAMILDGNVDPIAWTNGGRERASLSTSLRLGSDKASAKTLDAFLTLCGKASKEQCAFSAGSPEATKERWKKLLNRLRERPVTVDGVPFDQATLADYMGGVVFTVEPRPGFQGWTAGAKVLHELWEGSKEAASETAPTSSGGQPAPSAEQKYAGTEQELAVQCSESPNPSDPNAFRRLGELAYDRAGVLGLNMLWGDEPCASWPATAANRYVGPWDRRTANPILVIGNTFDPATPYQGSVAMSEELDRARLLTVDGYGHTVLLNQSKCASALENKYLVDGTLPQRGTVCQQNARPFGVRSNT